MATTSGAGVDFGEGVWALEEGAHNGAHRNSRATPRLDAGANGGRARATNTIAPAPTLGGDVGVGHSGTSHRKRKLVRGVAACAVLAVVATCVGIGVATAQGGCPPWSTCSDDGGTPDTWVAFATAGDSEDVRVVSGAEPVVANLTATVWLVNLDAAGVDEAARMRVAAALGLGTGTPPQNSPNTTTAPALDFDADVLGAGFPLVAAPPGAYHFAWSFNHTAEGWAAHRSCPNVTHTFAAGRPLSSYRATVAATRSGTGTDVAPVPVAGVFSATAAVSILQLMEGVVLMPEDGIMVCAPFSNTTTGTCSLPGANVTGNGTAGRVAIANVTLAPSVGPVHVGEVLASSQGCAGHNLLKVSRVWHGGSGGTAAVVEVVCAVFQEIAANVSISRSFSTDTLGLATDGGRRLVGSSLSYGGTARGATWRMEFSKNTAVKVSLNPVLKLANVHGHFTMTTADGGDASVWQALTGRANMALTLGGQLHAGATAHVETTTVVTGRATATLPATVIGKIPVLPMFNLWVTVAVQQSYGLSMASGGAAVAAVSAVAVGGLNVRLRYADGQLAGGVTPTLSFQPRIEATRIASCFMEAGASVSVGLRMSMLADTFFGTPAIEAGVTKRLEPSRSADCAGGTEVTNTFRATVGLSTGVDLLGATAALRSAPLPLYTSSPTSVCNLDVPAALQAQCEVCDPDCGEGQPCTSSTQCASSVCDTDTYTCARPSCADDTRNGFETCVDGGGADCGATCVAGKSCKTGDDCVSGVCVAATCVASRCDDGVLNGDETCVDGGGSECSSRCGIGEGCTGGGDCTFGVCVAATCVAPTCDDGVLNGFETCVDGGGSCDGKCQPGTGCFAAGDCVSGVCNGVAHTCSAPTCDDGVMNGYETCVDGSGDCSSLCGTGEGCVDGDDCVSGVCDGDTVTCATPACDDGVLNGDETCVDGGGGTCSGKCPTGTPCQTGDTCTSGVCRTDTWTCRDAAGCADGKRNADETITDGGGGCPNKAGHLARCLTATDCAPIGGQLDGEVVMLPQYCGRDGSYLCSCDVSSEAFRASPAWDTWVCKETMESLVLYCGLDTYRGGTCHDGYHCEARHCIPD